MKSLTYTSKKDEKNVIVDMKATLDNDYEVRQTIYIDDSLSNATKDYEMAKAIKNLCEGIIKGESDYNSVIDLENGGKSIDMRAVRQASQNLGIPINDLLKLIANK